MCPTPHTGSSRGLSSNPCHEGPHRALRKLPARCGCQPPLCPAWESASSRAQCWHLSPTHSAMAALGGLWVSCLWRDKGEEIPPLAPVVLGQGWDSSAMPGGCILRPGTPGCQRGLSWDTGSSRHNTLSSHRAEPAVPAPPATHTIISAGRAEAWVIIGGDSLRLESRAPWAQQDFPAGLVCGTGPHPVLRLLCGAWLAPRHQSGAGYGGERCHHLHVVPRHVLAPPSPCNRHGCGLASDTVSTDGESTETAKERQKTG